MAPTKSRNNQNEQKPGREAEEKERCLCCPDKALIEKSALRQHLTDVHSKALAKALLMPDPNCPEELWLHRIAFQSIQADNCAEAAVDSGQRKASKRKKTSEAAPTATIKTAPLTLSNKRIRKPSLIIRESLDNQENGRTNKVRNRVKKEEESDMTAAVERKSGRVDETLQPSSPSKRIKDTAKQIQQSTRMSPTCRQCGEGTEGRASHVLVKHMNSPMFECPLCRFSSDSFERIVVDHIESVHKSHANLVPLDNRRRYSHVYKRLLAECFGGDDEGEEKGVGDVADSSRPVKAEEVDEPDNSPPMRRSRRRNVQYEQRPETDDDDAEDGELVASKKKPKRSGESDEDFTVRRASTRASPRKRRNSDADYDCRSSTRKKAPSRHSVSSVFYQQQPWVPNRSPPKTSSKSAGDLDDPEVCHMCRQKVTLMRKRHVLQYHFPMAVYECSVCDFVSYAQSSVHKHVESSHEGADPPAVAVSHLADMAGEIADMQRKCFPLQAIRRVFKTRRKSLFKFSTVRVVDGRELVYCKLCDNGIKEKAFRHVLEHLDQPVYACRYCSETSPTDLTIIRKHSLRAHPEQTEQEPLVHIANYQAEIDALYEQCFEKVPRQEHERLFKRKVPPKRSRKPKKPAAWQP